MIRRSSFHLPTLPILLGLAAGAIAPGTLAAEIPPGFVYETATEFQTVADVNGDGTLDLVVVDKATGQFRIAEGDGNGDLSWRETPGDSGLAGVTGFSAGPIFDPQHDALVFAEPFANRIHVVDAADDSRLTDPTIVSDLQLHGPALVTAVNIPGTPSGFVPDRFDILYHGLFGTPKHPMFIGGLRNRGFALLDQFDIEPTESSRRPNRVVLQPGTPELVGVIVDFEEESHFRLLDPTGAGLVFELALASGFPPGVQYVYADLNGNGSADFIFFVPGSSIFYTASWDAGISNLSEHDFGDLIKDIRVIASTGNPELIVLLEEEDVAFRAAFDPNYGLMPVEEFFTSKSHPFTAAFSLGDRLHFLTGDGSGTSLRLLTYEFDGGEHQQTNSQPMTPLKSPVQGASVLLFDSKPLIDPNARLLGRYDAGPWTSAFTLFGGQASVTSELFRGPGAGLGGNEIVTIPSTPPGTIGGLTNQVDSDVSLLFQDRPVGRTTGHLTLDPPGGTYSEAVRPVLTLDRPGTIRYRIDGQTGWQIYGGTTIFTDTTFYGVANTANGSTNIVKATYTFTKGPAEIDSNGDGLPDFVADMFGLDPFSPDRDSDGDGFTDLQELLAGTDPNDASDHPSRADVAYEYPHAFDLVAAPAVPNPANTADLLRANPNAPARMTVHQPNGFFLGGAVTDSTPHTAAPAASFSALEIADPDLFVIAATEANFSVRNGIPRDHGRQVAAIVTPPEKNYEPFAYRDFGAHGGLENLAAEAKAWLAAARAHYENLRRETVVEDPVGPESTLTLLLVETFLGQRLHDRGLSDRPNISLTPFRSSENPLAPDAEEAEISTRNRAVTHADLIALQRHDHEHPSFQIRSVIAQISEAVANANSNAAADLVELTTRLYTASATSAAPGSLRQPFDALRAFLQNGNLANTGYDQDSASFPASLLASAQQGVQEILGLVSPREFKEIHLFYSGSENASGCQLWQEVVYSQSFDPDNPVLFGTQYRLIDDQGDPYPIARAFPLTPGSVFSVSGFVEESADCGDFALEVIPQPRLVYVRNANPVDLDGDLIPDSIQDLLGNHNLSPFDDTDGDGYSDLQEILMGSDPSNPSSVPTDNGSPLPVADLSPPDIRIESTEAGHFRLSFDFPRDYRSFFEFELYNSADLRHFEPTGFKASPASGNANQLEIAPATDRDFYIFHMKLR